MKTETRSINRSPLRCGFFTLVIALSWFALSPPLKAQCPSACGAGGNTAVGDGALDSVTTGINNTAVGKDALTSDTNGAYNVAIGRSALQANVSGNFNMAIGTEALKNSTSNFNLAIGYRVGSMNTTGRHLTGIGAEALGQNTTGDFNTAIGATALQQNSMGDQNTAVGAGALQLNTVDNNTAIGSQALTSSTTSHENVAVGFRALANTSGTNGFNVAVGFQALDQVTTGGQNTAVGDNALGNIVTGTLNTALGDLAGVGHSGSDSGNVDIGAFTVGTSGESNTTRISNILNTFQPFVAGVVGFVTVGPGNKLGNGSFSSRRYKDDIKPMDKASEEIFALKPVSFRYKKEFEPTHSQQYGLIAEDVVKVDPNLAVYDEEGKARSVRYDLISNMLLNEFLKEHKRVEEQQASIAELKSTVALQQKGMQVLTAQLKEQAAQIQKVSAQLEASKPAPKIVSNK